MKVPTPYSMTQYDTPIDVFEQIIPNTETYYVQKRAALWARFHDTGIGNTDTAYWMRCMTSRYTELKAEWDVKFRAWEEYLTRLGGYSSVDLSDSKLESESINRVYDPPETAISGSAVQNWLSDENHTDFTQKTYGGLEPETVRQYIDAVDSPYRAWAAEFDRLFYWGL